jgi:CPA1 family monovalent cation:H+ antiporter
VTTLIVGSIVAWGAPLGLPVALVFGALIAATDPVAVVALFRSLGIPKRLLVLVEGESLLNDGTAIVLFNILLAVALTGSFDPVQGVTDFIRVAAGGTIIGLVLGWLISRLIERIDDYLIETTLTTVLAFGSYLVADRLGFSGVLAVVAAGLVNGNLGSRGMSPTTRIVLHNFWEYVAFLANSLVFLLIGLKMDVPSLLAAWQPILWAIAAILAARIVVVYGLAQIMNRFDNAVPLAWQHVLTWGGQRGAISLALVLSLPIALGTERELLKLMAFGVVLFTLLVQGTSMRPLLRRLKIGARTDAQVEYETRHARVVALRAAVDHLDRMYRDGLISLHVWETLKPELNARAAALAEAVRQVLRDDPVLEAEELDTALRETLRAQRSALLGLRRDGVISEQVFEKLSSEVDALLMGDPAQAIPVTGIAISEKEEPAGN